MDISVSVFHYLDVNIYHLCITLRFELSQLWWKISQIRNYDQPLQEVLRYGSVKLRAEAMSHFIRVAKRLHELNNLNAEYAILSALQSAPIYRLGHTWASLSRKVIHSCTIYSVTVP